MPIQFVQRGLEDYATTFQAMKTFTEQRDAHTADQVWFVQHPPVYTQGLNGKAHHLLNPPAGIPIIQTDRGGQITYHGPGQLIAYLLIDLKRRKLGVRQLVHQIENTLIALLAQYNITAQADPNAPGVYVDGKKIASLGLKVKKQACYHGLALNVNMDLAPFNHINPCGLLGMQMTQLSHFLPADKIPIQDVSQTLQTLLTHTLNCTQNTTL